MFRGGWCKTGMTCVCKYVAATSPRLARTRDGKREGSVIDLLSSRTSDSSLSISQREKRIEASADRTVAMAYLERVTRDESSTHNEKGTLASPVRSKRCAVRAA